MPRTTPTERADGVESHALERFAQPQDEQKERK
jgi:hypothetical protein